MDKSRIPVEPRAALSLLLDDHRSVKDLFKQFRAAEHAHEKEAIARDTCRELTVHAQIEEEIFYPALRGLHHKLDEMLDEAKVEHQVAKDLIAKIEKHPSDEMLEANYTVLCEYVSHHINEEERELFPAAVKARVPWREVGEKLAARKDELIAQLA